MRSLQINNKLQFETKGVTPKYVEKSNTIVLNQKCVRHGFLDYSFARHISDEQKIPLEKYVKVGDILLNSTGTGTAGRCALVEYIPEGYKVTIDSHMLVLRFNNIDISSFFNYSLYRQENLILDLLTGSSGQGELDRESVYNISFPFVENNLTYFNFLYSIISKKIELNNKINSELEILARTLYDYWFVQFDFPDELGRPYKSAGGSMEYNPILKREIPKGWAVENLAANNLTKILKPGIKQFDNEKTYLATACIGNDQITDYTNKITFDNREGRANMQPIANSIWFAKMKNTKKVLYFGDYSAERMNELIISTGMLGLQVPSYGLEYVWNFINNDSFEILKNKLSHGATQEGVNNDDLQFMPIIIPTKEILAQFCELVKSVYQQKYENEQEAKHLAELRDFLLPMLMNGQVLIS